MADFDLSGSRNIGSFVITNYKENTGVYRWIFTKFGTAMILPTYLYTSDGAEYIYDIDRYISAGAYYNFSTPYASKAVIFNSWERNGETEYHGICLRTDGPLSTTEVGKTGDNLFYEFCVCDKDGNIKIRSALGYSHKSAIVDIKYTLNYLTYTRNDAVGNIRVAADFNIESSVSTYAWKSYSSFGNPSAEFYQYYTRNENYFDLDAIYPNLEVGSVPDFSVSSSGEGTYDNKSDIISTP